jgi:hypothetical protein
MSYVVYHRKSTQLIKSFKLESAARRSKTCMNRNAGADEYAYTLEEMYHKEVVKKIKVKSLMTGQEVEIDSNTPWSCRPDSESYWSN